MYNTKKIVKNILGDKTSKNQIPGMSREEKQDMDAYIRHRRREGNNQKEWDSRTIFDRKNQLRDGGVTPMQAEKLSFYDWRRLPQKYKNIMAERFGFPK